MAWGPLRATARGGLTSVGGIAHPMPLPMLNHDSHAKTYT